MPGPVTGVISCGDYSIEKVIFASAEHVLVSANLYLPAGCRQDLAAVLLVCGHDPEGKQAAEYQRACIRLVQAGLAVLVMDSFGQGERASYYDAEAGTERVGRCTREHDYAGFPCMLAGDSAARYLIRDACAGGGLSGNKAGDRCLPHRDHRQFRRRDSDAYDHAGGSQAEDGGSRDLCDEQTGLPAFRARPRTTSRSGRD